MSGLAFMIDGVPVAPADVSWYEHTPCGCVSGCMVAEHIDGRVTASEEDAWREYEPRPTHRKRKRKAGARLVPGLRADAVRLIVECPHTPKYGMPVRPTPQGYSWAGYGYGCDAAKRKHLVLTAETETVAPWPAKWRSLCGRQENAWHADSRAVHDLPECTRCWNKATVLIGAEAAGVAAK